MLCLESHATECSFSNKTADVKLNPLLIMSISMSRGATRAGEPAQSRSADQEPGG